MCADVTKDKIGCILSPVMTPAGDDFVLVIHACTKGNVRKCAGTDLTCAETLSAMMIE